MKKLSIFLWTFLIIWITQINNTIGQTVVCIDPGHGGPGASQYSNGGDGYGGYGPNGLSEQWVNFQVALEFKERLEDEVGVDVIMTRESEADTNLPLKHTDNLWYRTNKGNYGNQGGNVDHFISIHHNGLALNEQGTEVFWCSTDTTDSGYNHFTASTDSLLAWKIPYHQKGVIVYNRWCGFESFNL